MCCVNDHISAFISSSCCQTQWKTKIAPPAPFHNKSDCSYLHCFHNDAHTHKHTVQIKKKACIISYTEHLIFNSVYKGHTGFIALQYFAVILCFLSIFELYHSHVGWLLYTPLSGFLNVVNANICHQGNLIR